MTRGRTRQATRIGVLVASALLAWSVGALPSGAVTRPPKPAPATKPRPTALTATISAQEALLRQISDEAGHALNIAGADALVLQQETGVALGALEKVRKHLDGDATRAAVRADARAVRDAGVLRFIVPQANEMFLAGDLTAELAILDGEQASLESVLAAAGSPSGPAQRASDASARLTDAAHLLSTVQDGLLAVLAPYGSAAGTALRLGDADLRRAESDVALGESDLDVLSRALGS